MSQLESSLSDKGTHVAGTKVVLDVDGRRSFSYNASESATLQHEQIGSTRMCNPAKMLLGQQGALGVAHFPILYRDEYCRMSSRQAIHRSPHGQFSVESSICQQLRTLSCSQLLCGESSMATVFSPNISFATTSTMSRITTCPKDSFTTGLLRQPSWIQHGVAVSRTCYIWFRKDHPHRCG